VQVRDAGDGQLRVSVHNLNTDFYSKSGPAISASVDFVNATSDVVTEKEVYNADMRVSIDGQQVQAGDVLTYVITYTNYTGVDAVVEIRDIIPAHTTYVEGSASHGGTYAGSHIHWILTVGMDESVTVSFQVEVNEVEGVQITNEAVVIEGDNTYTTNEVTNEIPEPEPTEPEPTEPEPTEPEPTEPEPTEPQPEGPPKTGDPTSLGSWFAALFVSGGGVISTIVLGRKRKEQEIQ
jgi:uncharacterized repeat protein (TIGR01451 family)